MRQVVRQFGLGSASGAPNTGSTASKCLFDVYDSASQAQTLTDCVVAVANASAQYTNAGAAIWSGAEQGALNGLKAVALADSALVAAYGALSLAGGAAWASTIITGLIDAALTLITEVAYDLGIVLTIEATATTIGAAAGPYGAAIGAVIGAIVAVSDYLVSYDSHLQITNGTTLAVRDYGGIVQTAMKWLQQASPAEIVGLTPLSFSNQATIFLANPTWLYGNQVITGLPQPPPPDQGSGSGIDVAYTQLPGAYEALEMVQFSHACALVAGNAGRLPFFSSIPNPTGTPINVSNIPVDPAVFRESNPNNFNPLWTQGLLTWNPPNVTPPGGASQKAPNIEAAGAPTAWPPGNNFGGGGGPMLQAPNISSGNPMGPNIAYQDYIYASCLNLTTNDNTRDSNGRITGQTDPAAGAFMLQQLYPALTTSDCLMIFTAAMPAYNENFAAAQTWANSQCGLTASELAYEFGLTPGDATTIMNQWSNPNKGCIDKQTAMTLLQYWVNLHCPPPSADLAWHQTGGASGPLTLIDAQKVVDSWSNSKCITAPPPGTPGAPGTKSPLVRGAALAGGVGAIGVAWYAARHGLTVTRAAQTLYASTKQVAVKTVKRLKPRFKFKRRRR